MPASRPASVSRAGDRAAPLPLRRTGIVQRLAGARLAVVGASEHAPIERWTKLARSLQPAAMRKPALPPLRLRSPPAFSRPRHGRAPRERSPLRKLAHQRRRRRHRDEGAVAALGDQAPDAARRAGVQFQAQPAAIRAEEAQTIGDARPARRATGASDRTSLHPHQPRQRPQPDMEERQFHPAAGEGVADAEALREQRRFRKIARRRPSACRIPGSRMRRRLPQTCRPCWSAIDLPALPRIAATRAGPRGASLPGMMPKATRSTGPAFSASSTTAPVMAGAVLAPAQTSTFAVSAASCQTDRCRARRPHRRRDRDSARRGGCRARPRRSPVPGTDRRAWTSDVVAALAQHAVELAEPVESAAGDAEFARQGIDGGAVAGSDRERDPRIGRRADGRACCRRRRCRRGRGRARAASAAAPGIR